MDTAYGKLLIPREESPIVPINRRPWFLEDVGWTLAS
jgi:hypothetical protein